MREDVLGVLESASHLGVCTFQRFVQRHGSLFACLCEVGDQFLFRVEKDFSFIVEVDLDYFVV